LIKNQEENKNPNTEFNNFQIETEEKNCIYSDSPNFEIPSITDETKIPIARTHRRMIDGYLNRNLKGAEFKNH
jgi:hypothetical protein